MNPLVGILLFTHIFLIPWYSLMLVVVLLVARQDNIQLQQFLEARNPKKDPSLNFEALMAKPIVVGVCSTHVHCMADL